MLRALRDSHPVGSPHGGNVRSRRAIRSQVSSSFQQMGCEGWAQGMTRNSFFDSCRFYRTFECFAVNLAMQMMPSSHSAFRVDRYLSGREQPKPLKAFCSEREFSLQCPRCGRLEVLPHDPFARSNVLSRFAQPFFFAGPLVASLLDLYPLCPAGQSLFPAIDRCELK